MPELRKDPIIGRWVIISTERGKRPTDFTDRAGPRRGSFCPFCPGNEDKTPPEVLAFRNPGGRRDGPGWQVRVVPNKFPALQIEGDMDRRAEGLYDKMNGIGAHEVIIETPEHECELSLIPIAGIEQVLHAYRERMVDLRRDRRFRYLMLFKNHGEAAGATLEHGHTQIIATPVVPKRVQEELDGARGHFELKERCIFCDMIAQERQDGRRIVVENDEFLAFAPFASRFAFETWLLPKRHESHFEEGDPGRHAHPYRAGAQSPAVQLHLAHEPHQSGPSRSLSLAFRDHAEADQDRRLRVGNRVPHQSDTAGRSGRVPAGDRDPGRRP